MTDRASFGHGSGASIWHISAAVCLPHIAEWGLHPLTKSLLPSLPPFGVDLFTLVVPACVACLCESYTSFAMLYLLLLLAAVARIRCAATTIDEQRALSVLNDERSPVLTRLRSSVALLTAFCILAVDFRIFPRASAKTLTYGRSIMDLGVGAVVLAGALTTSTRRALGVKNHLTKGGGDGGGVDAGRGGVRRVLLRHSPLVAAGFGRIAAVRAASYHEVHSEYGVHWNFFFTLAVVAASSSALEEYLLRTVSSRGDSVQRGAVMGTCALCVLLLHQAALTFGGLSAYVRDETAPRVTLLAANREGLASLPGYLAISLAGRAASGAMLRVRLTVRAWWQDIGRLFALGHLLLTASLAADWCVEPSSRRLCNLSYVLWVLAQVSIVISLATIGSLLAVTAPIHSGGDERGTTTPLLWDALNRHPLSVFLLANLLTGACNLSMDTTTVGDTAAAAVLSVYMLVVCLAAMLLTARTRAQ